MKAITLIALVSFLMPCAFAQDRPAVTAQPNSVYVGADGKYEAAPDTAVMQFEISAQENTSQEAYTHASQEAEKVRQVLRANGIDPKTAKIGFFAVQPLYDYRNPKQKVIGYRVTTEVTLKLKDFEKIGPITQQLADANVSERQTLDYTLEKMEQAKDEAVEDAYRRARESAETVARASGRVLGELSYASVDVSEPVRPIMARMARPMAMAAGAPAAPTEEFTAQTVTISAHLNAVFNLK